MYREPGGIYRFNRSCVVMKKIIKMLKILFCDISQKDSPAKLNVGFKCSFFWEDNNGTIYLGVKA